MGRMAVVEDKRVGREIQAVSVFLTACLYNWKGMFGIIFTEQVRSLRNEDEKELIGVHPVGSTTGSISAVLDASYP